MNLEDGKIKLSIAIFLLIVILTFSNVKANMEKGYESIVKENIKVSNTVTNETLNTTSGNNTSIEQSNTTSTTQQESNNSTQTESTTNSGTSTQSQTNTSRTQSSSSTTKKSSNANLSNLGIRPNDFSGFTPNTTTYNVTVEEDVDTVEVYATAQDSKSTISGIGNKTINYGENALDIVVTAEDGTTKTYTINITREEENDVNETEVETVKNGLSNITIEHLQLNPTFKTDVYEYTVKYIGEDTSLNIQAVATDTDYNVEILGNSDLVEGENIITILVSNSEGNNVATYQLIVNKSLIDEEALAREEAERQKQEKMKLYMIAGGIIGVIVILVIGIAIKSRRNRVYAEEFSGIPFTGLNDEDGNDSWNNYNELNEYSYKDVDEFENRITEKVEKLENLSQNTEILDENKSAEDSEKEKAKIEFLENYNMSYEDYKGDKRARKKGKRFK